MSKQSGDLVDEILEFLWSENPVEATMAGVHRYDDRLEKLDLVSRRNKLRRKREYVDRIIELKAEKKSSLALDLLRDGLEVGIRMEEAVPSLDRDAGTYPRLALYGVYQLIARSNAPNHFRALRSVDRLREIPRILAEGQLNIGYGENVPYILTIGAVELCARGRDYLSRLTSLLRAEVPELENVIQKYSDSALRAFEDYLDFLMEEVQPRANSDCAVGEEILDFLLRRELHLDYGVDQIRNIARQEAAEAEEALCGEAARLGGTSDWRSLLAFTDEVQVSGNDLLERWRETIAEVRKAVKDAGLVTLPAEDDLTVCETPPFERMVIQTAGYIEAPWFEEGGKAYFCVTGPDSSASEKDLAGKSFSHLQAVLTVLRELYPGRHTLLLHRRKYFDNRLSYLARGNVVEQGWPGYMLNLAAERGLFDEPALRLHVWHHRLVSAWRILVDLDLHTGELDETGAVNRLAAGTAVAEKTAWSQVSAMAATPGASVAALAGRITIDSWRSRYRKKAGRAYSDKKFHDRLLRLSVLPPAQIGKRLALASDGRKK